MAEEIKQTEPTTDAAIKTDAAKIDAVKTSPAKTDSAKTEAAKTATAEPAPDRHETAAKKFEKVRQTARNFSSDRPRRDRHDRRGRGDRRSNEPKQFEEQTISIDRVSRTVKGGRRLRFKALVVVGDRKARVGVGVSKGGDVQAAIAKATDVAKKNLITIPIEKETIPHSVEEKLTGARVLLKPAAPGTGIIAGGVVRSIIGVTGIKNLLSKSLGSSNKVNIAYATINALKSLVPRADWVGAKKTDKAKTAAAKEPSND
ncbi:MAG: 30S ribosomal protein S5 [Candidatus Nomurabacteria bacterium]|jgi:small subunit ribosomal protein S5|nr:30S ribosomal protein S5 [Candidatus Nomurabacteria bacterium]